VTEDDDADRRIAFGSVLPLNLPEYLRVGTEYFHDFPQGEDVPNRDGVAAEVLLAF
jgi:hypothetical protein